MIDDIRAAGLSVPAVTVATTASSIPFVYPPAALLGSGDARRDVRALRRSMLLRWAPLALSILGLVAFAWLAYRTLNPAAAAAATLAYALMPSAYGWLVAGGGLTRGAGLVFALLAAGLVAAKPGREPTWRTAVGAGVLLGLSALCHPQTAAFGVIACVVLSWRRPARPWLVHVGDRRGRRVPGRRSRGLPGWSAQGGLDAFVGAGGRLRARDRAHPAGEPAVQCRSVHGCRRLRGDRRPRHIAGSATVQDPRSSSSPCMSRASEAASSWRRRSGPSWLAAGS